MYVSVTRMVLLDQAAAVKKSDRSTWTGTGFPLKMAGLVQVLGWYMQLHPGHGIFEGSKPALLDSFGQAFSVAPLFAFYEGLWAFGIHAELQARTLAVVAANAKALCAAGATLRACSG